MELVIDDGDGQRSVSIDADMDRHTVGDLRRALGCPSTVDSTDAAPLGSLGLHRGMQLRPVAGGPGIVVVDGRRGEPMPDRDGRIPVMRSAELSSDRPARPERNALPDGPADLPEIPWWSAVPGLAVAGLMAAVWSPLFASIGAASAIIPLIRSLVPRILRNRTLRRHGRAMAAYEAATEAADQAWERELDTWLRRRVSSPGQLDELIGSAMLRPWVRRLRPGDPLAVGIGMGRRHWPTAGRAGDRSAPDRAIEDIPLVLEIERGLAIDGDRGDVLDLARWVVTEVGARHGPADLDITLVTTPDRCIDWDWMKWLPGLCAVSADEATRTSVFDAVAGSDGPCHLVVVDGVRPTGPGPLARLLSGQLDRCRVLWIGDGGDVPAACTDSVLITGDGYVRMSSGEAAGWAWRLADHEAEEFCRFMAPFSDPEIEPRAVALPTSVPLARLCSAIDDSGSGGGVVALAQHWAQASPARCPIPLGVSADGPLVIDLVGDGPHILVAGTTGSGKSELLRTMVVGAAAAQPPELVSFVLIDFKGGGAFDAVADLPHVAAVVTDLEPAAAQRALQSLRAELHDRERLLRAAGVSDLRELHGGPPRLVVMVDEFAAFRDELPDFLDGLVDVARRGRSLGVHLVLATQRPSGAITTDIRANMNLRICLRVRDAADSIDVIESKDAALLPAVPGRAVVTMGGTSSCLVQVAFLGGDQQLTVRPFDLGRAAPLPDADHDWLKGLVDTMGRLRPESTTAPWLPPLPPQIPAESLWPFGAELGQWIQERSATGVVGSAPIGVLDDPDRRRQLPLTWSPHDGGLLVAGADPHRVAATIATTIAAVALVDPDVVFVVLVGGRPAGTEVAVGSGASGLDRLGVLGSVADVIHHRDRDRLVRAIDVVEQSRAAGERIVLVVHRWGSVVDALVEYSGPDAAHRLARLFADGSIVPLIGVTTDRELPGRVLTDIRHRFVHALADPHAGLSFDLHPSLMPKGPNVVEVGSTLNGVVADVSDHALAQVAAWSVPRRRPRPVRVLDSVMPLGSVEGCAMANGSGWWVPLGFDENLESFSVEVSARRPLVVIGRAGSGRTTALATVGEGLVRLGVDPCGWLIVDDADRDDDAAVRQRTDTARAEGRSLVLAIGPASVRSFGGWVAPLLSDATVVLLTPGRGEAEVVRATVPDLGDRPPGRAAVLDRGRATVIQVAVVDSA